MSYHVEQTSLPGVLVLTPRVFEDERGFFFESFNQRHFNDAIGSNIQTFVQDNHSRSMKGTLRGLHFQNPNPQGKLVRVVAGSVFDVAVDIRSDSPTYGNWFGVELSASNRKQLWVPPGIAHGFLTTSETADFLYKTTDYYAPKSEYTLAWNDEHISIRWPIISTPYLMSEKDRLGLTLNEIENQLIFDPRSPYEMKFGSSSTDLAGAGHGRMNNATPGKPEL